MKDNNMAIKHDYDKYYIKYESQEDEIEAYNLGIKFIITKPDTFPALGINSDSTYTKGLTNFKKLSDPKTKPWSEIKKLYAKHLDYNPFNVGDTVECINNNIKSPMKKIGDIYTISRIKDDYIYYNGNYLATYKDFKIILDDKKSNKNWTDAFLEIDPLSRFQKINYSTQDTIMCENNAQANDGKNILAYVSMFNSGGFWLNEGKIYFVIIEDSKKIATYEHAKQFISNFKEKDLL